MPAPTVPPPHSLEAEETILGLLLRGADQAFLADLSEDDFYSSCNQEVFRAMRDMVGSGTPLEPVLLLERLKSRGTIEKVGGGPYVHTLYAVAPHVGQASYYAALVRRLARLRRLATTGLKIYQLAYELPEDVDAAYEQAAAHIQSDIKPNGAGFLIGPHVDAWRRSGAATPLGYQDVDDLLGGGLRGGQLCIVAGRPGMGKTAFALNVACRIAGRGQAAALFSLEMSRPELVLRTLSLLSGLPMRSIERGGLGSDQSERFEEAREALTGLPLYVDDSGLQTPDSISARSRRFADVRCVIVDYLQLMTVPHQTGNRVAEVSEITRRLKMLAKELDVPVVAVSQLSRAVEYRSSGRPQLSDLRDSGSIEQDADIVMFVWREQDQRTSEIIIAKNRSGPVGHALLRFHGSTTSFEGV